MTEDELVAEVMKLCRQLGLLSHHCRDSRICDGKRGLPDLIITGEHGLIFAEIKSEDGETRPDQDLWLWTLRRAGAVVALWRPSELEAGIIQAELELIA